MPRLNDRVTQLVEYFLDMEEVVGSSPIVITTFIILFPLFVVVSLVTYKSMLPRSRLD